MQIEYRKGRFIGQNHPVFIIAEIGSNWLDLDHCLTSIKQAKESGANAVKFQLFNIQSMYGLSKKEADKHPLKKWELNPKWLPNLKNLCENLDIEFMCSAFSPQEVEIVNEYVNIHKVASLESTSDVFNVVSSSGKPYLVSHGAEKADEAHNIAKLIDPNCVNMHCVSGYPVPLEQACMKHIYFSTTLYGLSDHTLDPITCPIMAVAMGACVIEKHFKLHGIEDTPDAGHSLSPSRFQYMTHHIRRAESALGDGVKRIMPCEEEAASRRRVLVDGIWRRRLKVINETK